MARRAKPASDPFEDRIGPERPIALYPEWVEEYGSCRDDRSRFDSTEPADVQHAKRICRRCSALPECTARAMGDTSIEGTWAALTAAEPVALRQVLGKQG